MITAAELALIPLFTGLDESARQRLAQKAADIRTEGGDWIIREGEDPRFFAVLEGLLQVVKDIVGQRRDRRNHCIDPDGPVLVCIAAIAM